MKRTIALGLTAVALAGCSLQPNYVRPEAAIPASWPRGSAYLAQSERDLPSISYAELFGDPRLQSIIAKALVNNQNLKEAAANIASARAQYRIQRADILPRIDTSAGVSINHGGGSSYVTGVGNGVGDGTGTGIGNGTGNGAGNGTGTGTGNGTGNGNGNGNGTGTGGGVGNGAGGGGVGTGFVGGGGGGTQTYYTANVGTTAFELDLFGRVRSLSEAALDQYFATEAAARSTRLALVGDIASGWFTYGADMSLMKIAQDTVDSAQHSVALTRTRLEGGIAPRTDLRQAQTVLARARADLAAQKTELAQDVNRLRLLVGADVDEALLPQSIEDATEKLGTVPAGIDSGILLRRPDVVQAEYRLRSMNAQIGAARAELFPRISLTALLGVASGSLSGLFSGDGFNFQVRPNVSYPIFRGGAGIANVAQAKAERDAAIASYEETIQSAFRDVADALARRGTIDEQAAATQELVDAAQDNYQLSYARYRGGIDSFLQSLDAQRSLYMARQSLVQAKLTRATNLSTLYQALGGDSTLVATERGPIPADAPSVPADIAN